MRAEIKPEWMIVNVYSLLAVFVFMLKLLLKHVQSLLSARGEERREENRGRSDLMCQGLFWKLGGKKKKSMLDKSLMITT